MNTKKRILDVALTLFSEKGYGNVYVGEIAEGVGIKAPSLYKHYKSKQDIFDAILVEMKERYDKKAMDLHMNGSNVDMDGEMFSEISEEELVNMGVGLFLHFLHDDYECRFRKMLTLEQFHNPELAQLFSKQYMDAPLTYQREMFEFISASGKLKQENPEIMALQFYAPIYTLLTLCDRQPEREEEAMQILTQHIRQFNTMYRVGAK